MEIKDRIFVEKKDPWMDCFREYKTTKALLGTTVADNAIILPLKNNEYSEKPEFAYLGGVCSNDFDFIAGCFEKEQWYSCTDAYRVDQGQIIHRNEIAIYGGVFYSQFGHLLLRSLVRLWWIIENTETNYKIVFLPEVYNQEIAEENCRKVMDILNIPATRYEILKRPSKFLKVIIPEQACTSRKDVVNEKFLTPFKAMRDFVVKERGKSNYKKIYLSRTRLQKGNEKSDGINEEYYENFYGKRGFFIVHPQELSLREQIRLVASAEEIVSTYGTLTHLATLFSEKKAKITMLLRSTYIDGSFPMQVALLKLCESDWYLVEAVKNPYPTRHDGGAFLYYPTQSFKDYLKQLKIDYDADELTAKITNEQIQQYLVRWLEVYSDPEGFRRLAQPELFPVLQALYYKFTGKILNQKDYK